MGRFSVAVEVEPCSVTIMVAQQDPMDATTHDRVAFTRVVRITNAWTPHGWIRDCFMDASGRHRSEDVGGAVESAS